MPTNDSPNNSTETVMQDGAANPRYAYIWERILACLIDAIVFSPLLVIVYAFALNAVSDPQWAGDNSVFGRGVADIYDHLAMRWVYRVDLIVGFFYCMFMEAGAWQASLGQRAMGIGVVDLQGRRISYWRATAHSILNEAFAFGCVIQPFTKRRQTLQDMITGCVLVKMPKTERAFSNSPKPRKRRLFFWLVGFVSLVIVGIVMLALPRLGKTMNKIGVTYANGDGVTTNKIMAFKWYKRASSIGNAKAMYNLGKCYMSGSGVSKDEEEAVNWFRKAAERGEVSAMRALGACYEDGDGVSKNEYDAVNWYRKAAETGDAEAMFLLGICYCEGTGVVKDEVAVFEWMSKAASRGFVPAMAHLAYCYHFGEGTTKDLLSAVKWYRKSVDIGDAKGLKVLMSCYVALGEQYHFGDGLPKDKEASVKWYRNAADLGSGDAMGALGFSYLLGDGVPQNEVYAYMWFNLAATKCNVSEQLSIILAGRERMRKDMTPEQIAEAQKMATEYSEKHGWSSGVK